MRKHGKIEKEAFLEEVRKTMEDEGFSSEMPDRIYDDLKKVRFDLENTTGFSSSEGFAGYPVGHRETRPGLHVFFVNAGGDWEFPVCFVFYWGHEGMLRAYVPKDGNAWCKKEKCAYGSEEDPTHGDDRRQYEYAKEISEKKMIEEINGHIISAT